MFSQLMTQFGVDLGTILEPHTELLLDRHETSYNVFHVPEALGSPHVPGQAQFVVPYGVRSVRWGAGDAQGLPAEREPVRLGPCPMSSRMKNCSSWASAS
jgi:hypothetical protein